MGTETPNTAEQQQIHQKLTNDNNNKLGPLSPSFKHSQRRKDRKPKIQQNASLTSPDKHNPNNRHPAPPNRASSGREPIKRSSNNKRVKPSPLQKKRIAKPKKLTSYQELHNNASPQRRSPKRSNVNNNNNIGQYIKNTIKTNTYHQQQQSMMSPNSRYHHQQQSQQQAMRSPNAIYHQSSY